MFELLSIMGNPKPYSGFYVQDVSGRANRVSIMKSNASAPTLTIETSSDGKAWTVLGQTSTTALNIQVPANKRVYLRCNTESWANNSGNTFYYNYFQSTYGATYQKNFKVGGNIMSLLYGSAYTGEETSFPNGNSRKFYNLFYHNSKLVDISDLELPATTLTAHCYRGMFSKCSSITTAPSLPATTLADYCYSNMFSSCTNLTAAPVLPATTLTEGCYYQMFSETAIQTAPVLPATIAVDSCYRGMFSGCTSLTTAPELPAANVTLYNCYSQMFNGCTSLNSVTVGATDWNSGSTTYWLKNVSATGTFTKPASTTIPTGIDGIPSGWTVVNV